MGSREGEMGEGEGREEYSVEGMGGANYQKSYHNFLKVLLISTFINFSLTISHLISFLISLRILMDKSAPVGTFGGMFIFVFLCTWEFFSWGLK